MSKNRKHVKQQLLTEYPEPNDQQSIVRVVQTRGTNQVEVEYPHGEKMLVLMPSKFRKLMWTKRGDYVIIKTDQNTVHDIKIKGIIECILMPQQIKHLKNVNIWPKEFDETEAKKTATTTTDDDDDDAKEQENQQDEMLGWNPNHFSVYDDEDDDN